MATQKKVRIPIPAEIERQIKVQAGHKCTVYRCESRVGLHIHHIDENPSNNNPNNLILLCGECHTLAHEDKIDRKACRMYKDMLQKAEELHAPGITPDDLQRMKSDLVAELTGLVGAQPNPQPLKEEDKATQPPNPQVEAAATQAVALEQVGIHMPPDTIRSAMYALYFSGNTQQALTMQRAMVDSGMGNAVDFYNLGILLEETDRTKEAGDAYRKAIELNPKLAQAWCNLILLLKNMGREEDVVDAYLALLRTDPDNADHYNEFAYYLWQLNRFDEAEKQARKALKLDPNHSYAHATLGLLHFEKDNLEQGRRSYEKTIELSPNDLPLQQKFHYEYGRALSRNNHPDQAREHLLTARSIAATYVPKQDIDAELAKLNTLPTSKI